MTTYKCSKTVGKEQRYEEYKTGSIFELVDNSVSTRVYLLYRMHVLVI